MILVTIPVRRLDGQSKRCHFCKAIVIYKGNTQICRHPVTCRVLEAERPTAVEVVMEPKWDTSENLIP